ncbi:diflavin flavoprotein [Myxacorys almedinensis]|uniref:Flavin oxidoreductase n=1 Tax=Myxacorys almedinensis A TaxID=2690445 RepID=A0A8J8CKX8_9CYAN|nr:diflavin flavoprotein [Myxacorys almedinensis]NDJ17120.1 flavin oxidoreductase [Myxacorys almedinensis A]
MSDSRPRDVQIAEIGVDTQILRSRTWDRLKFEIEYARQKGTTANSYLIQAEHSALIDPPGSSFTDIFIHELHQHQYFQKLDYVMLSHVNQNRLETLKKLLELAPQVTIVCSKPAANALKAAFVDRPLQVQVVRDGDTLDLGKGHALQFAFVPTPRWVDELCVFDPATQILYTDKFFGSHVCDDSIFDDHWKQLDEDRRYYFDCLYAAQSKQVEAAIAQLSKFPASMYAVGHGSIVRYSLSRLTLDYRDWCNEQKNQERSVALLYASAYGNTATVAQAIAKGLTASEITVESINCEFADPADITAVVERCDGFIIGTPTLAGHAPTQIQTALGLVLSNASKMKVAGVFGSYGWSGEAIDLVENRLQDAGYAFGFDTIRVKFTPTEEVLQQSEKAGVEFAQMLRKTQKVREPRPFLTETSDRTEQALGRVVGSLCVVTVKHGDRMTGFLTSWISQATFNPPGVTVAIAKSRTEGWLDHIGDSFVLNVLREDRQLRRAFMKPVELGHDRFADLEIEFAANGCPILLDGLAYLECTVQNRMECGDHWLLYAEVANGKVLAAKAVTAVLHRKSGTSY